jgi:N-formylmaleamate deformylase
LNHWITGSCETNGINLHYTRTGGSKPPLIMLHGLTANGACWTEVARAFEEDYDVIMPDARGHGRSSRPDHGYQYENFASDVFGFIEVLQLSSPILIGHSMGGMTAALVASRRPELLRCLILADPTFLSLDLQHQVRKSDVADQHRRFLNMSLEDLVADARIKHPDRSMETIELIAKARLQTSINTFEVLTPPNPDYIQVVSAIEAPTLLVIGGPTGVVSPEVATSLQLLNPRLRVEQISEAGHGLHYDQPERFVTIFQSFLRSDLLKSSRIKTL